MTGITPISYYMATTYAKFFGKFNMPTVVFTSNLERHLECPPQKVVGNNLHDVLEFVFQKNPKLISYIVDDQFRIRKHILISIDNQLINDRIHLTDKVTPDSKVYVFQALSGG